MSSEHDIPSVLTGDATEAQALRRMLEYAQLIAGELKLPTTERLIGAALLSLNDAPETPRTECAAAPAVPDQIH